MAATCGGSCAKLLLIVFNYIFWMSGLAIIGVGIWFLVDPDFDHFFDIQEAVIREQPLLKYAAFILIGVGGLVFLVGFLGCCGAIRENKCLLGLYMLFMFLVMGGELAAGIYTLIYKERAKTFLFENWEFALNTTYGQDTSEEESFTKAQDVFQIKMKCCGANKGHPDFKNTKWQKGNSNLTFPLTCCALKEGFDNKGTVNSDHVLDKDNCQKRVQQGDTYFYHKEPCYEAVVIWIESQARILIGIGIGIAGLEIFGFIFAILLCRRIKPKD